MQRQVGIVINHQRFSRAEEVSKAIVALQQLPLPAFDTATVPDPNASVMILQREQAYVDASSARFIGTKRLSDCIFVMFTIINPAQQSSYFAVHIDGNDTYDWEAYFKSLPASTISLTVMGGFIGSPQGAKNLQQLMTYLLMLTTKLQIEMTITAQCVQQSFTPVLADWPSDFTFRIRNKTSVLYQRLFGKEFPTDLAQCAFDATMQQVASANNNLSMTIENTAFTWKNFVDFILDGDAIFKEMVDALHVNARTLAPTPEVFARLYKKLFSAEGFKGAEIAFSEINSLPKVKANNFVVDLHTHQIILVMSNYPDGKYALPRKLRVTDLQSRHYSDCFRSKEGYLFPDMSAATRQYFTDAASKQMHDLPSGLSFAVIDGFIKGLMHGYGVRQIGVNVTLETCWLAYHWSHAKQEDLKPTLTSAATKLLTRIPYLNKVTGVKFTANGDHDAIYRHQDPQQLLVIQEKLAACKITASIEAGGLLVANLVKYTETLRSQVADKSSKQHEGFSFKFGK